MRRLLVIGIGMGAPEGLTLAAIAAMNRAEVVFFLDKGEAAAELLAMRAAILDAHMRRPYRIVTAPSPKRRAPPAGLAAVPAPARPTHAAQGPAAGTPGEGEDAGARAYRAGVHDWHEARARLFAGLIMDELPEAGTGAFLVWGDPMLYDSTLRVLEAARAHGAAFELEVLPGISALQALCAAHAIPLNGIGEQVEVTTGRRLAAATPEAPTFAVLLDDGTGLAALMARGWQGRVWWGAYVGTPDEVLVAGRLAEVGEEILRIRADARARKGWVMDVWVGRG